MKKQAIAGASIVGAVLAVTGMSGVAYAASGDIPYFWNSGDQDAKLKFVSVGDSFTLCRGGTSAHVYFKWQTQSNGSGRVDAASSLGKNQCATYGFNFTENHWVKAQVCEEKGGIVPDDCSAWKTGAS